MGRFTLPVEIECEGRWYGACQPCRYVRGIIPKCVILGKFLKRDGEGGTLRLPDCRAKAVPAPSQEGGG